MMFGEYFHENFLCFNSTENTDLTQSVNYYLDLACLVAYISISKLLFIVNIFPFN